MRSFEHAPGSPPDNKSGDGSVPNGEVLGVQNCGHTELARKVVKMRASLSRRFS